MAKLTVSKIKHVLTADIDITQRYDVKVLDEYVNTCITAAQIALRSAIPPGFSEFSRDMLESVLEGMRSAHQSIRRLLKGEISASAVDALAIARLQLETLYSFCFLLQDANNVSLFLKSAWKKQYIRFLLMREECVNISRFDEYVTTHGAQGLDQMRKRIGVTDAEKLTIDSEQLGVPMPSGIVQENIASFPAPGALIGRITNPDQKSMLERLYPEYQWLCSFAHGDLAASIFRTALDDRTPASRRPSPEAREDIFQRHVAEDSVLYSAICAVQVATEVAAIYPGDIELMVKITNAWTGLNKFTFLACSVWERRARKVLPLI
ncbi:MAG: hypothetical protein ABSG62_04165 [Terracidiphilus sp.]